MRFLVDVCVGKRLATWLKEQGNDVCEVRERSAKMPDNEILQWAYTEKLIVITADKDFGTLAVLLKQPHNGIIRLPDVSAIKKQYLMKEILSKHEKDIEKGAIITVSENRVRIRYS
mgnify:CR=1 FL=1